VRTPGAAGGGAASEVEARGATLRYPPKYSPDLNPIEMPFSKLKADLRQGCRADNSAPPPPIGQFASTPVPVPERPSVVHSSLYLPEPVYEVRRKIAFDERLHALVLEGIDAALRRRGYPSTGMAPANRLVGNHDRWVTDWPWEKHCRSDVFACAFQLAWLRTLPATLVPRAGPVALWGLASCARTVIFRGQLPSASRAL
jgi:hypothetical protein